MKKVFLTVISCLTGMIMFAQSDVAALEYYIDDDPGVGMGTAVPVTQGQEIDLTFTVPISSMGLSDGVHFMVVRSQNLAGEWSMYERRVFYIQNVTPPPAPTPQDITALEYFIGDDPGVGMATSVAITPGQEIDITDIFSASALAAGFHTVTVRAMNNDNLWGFSETRVFYIQSTVTNPPVSPEDITELEYFFDDDPGVGLATGITITQGQALDITEIINASSLSDGFHTITVRAKNAIDRWGMSETRVVYVQNINPTNPTVAKLTAWEYFYDEDPGVGMGVQIPINPAADSIDIMSIMLETGDTLTIGPHTITIRAQNENGEWGHRETVTFNVDGACPIAGFTVQNACEGEPVQLIDTSAGFVGAVDYRWYADGQLISTFEGDTAHVFETPGIHTLSLAIENGAVCTDSTSVQITIKPKPIVIFNAETVELGTATTYTVDEFNVDPTFYWAWDFDTDGTIDDTTPGGTSYTFASDGTYLTTLSIIDSLGCGTTHSKMITVDPVDPGSSPGNPTARFSTLAVCEGSISEFTDLSTEIPAGSTYSWDFENDGTTDDTTVGDTQFTYSTPGTYTALLLIVTPEDDTLTYTANVEVTSEPTADFTVGPTCVGEEIEFTDLSSAGASASYSWDFDGDGTTDSTTVGDVTFSYADPGNYAASLLVDNGNGCFDFKVVNIVIVDPPQADFTFTYSTFGNVASVTFENLSVDGSDFSWDFGDGGTSTEENPSHDFTDYDSQVFDVCLTVTNGCTQTQHCEQLALTVTGVDEVVDADVKLYPNPAVRQFQLEVTNDYRGELTIDIVDLAGKILHSQNVRKTSQSISLTMSPEGLAPGVYMVRTSSENASAASRLTIK